MKLKTAVHKIIVNLRYRIKIAKLRKSVKTRKIRVLFYVTENQKWCYQSLYDLLAKSEIFEPFVVASILNSVHAGNDSTRNNLEENYEFFKSRGMNVEYGYVNGAYINLKDFQPDIVFYEQLWGLPHAHKARRVAKFAFTCYCPYGLSLFNQDEDYLFKNFIDSEINIKRFEKNIKGASKNCIATGYSKLDTYFDNQPTNLADYWRDPNKTKIIYAPHHSFEEE